MNIFKNLIYAHVKNKEDFELISKVSFLYIFTSMGVSVTFMFGIVNIATGRISIGTAEIIISLLQFFNIIYFIKKNNIVFTTNILNMLLYILFSILLIHGGIEKTGIYWIVMFPLIVYFTDNKYSSSWIILFIVTIIVIMILRYLGIINTPYSLIEYRQALISFLSISFILYFYHNIIIHQREDLIKSKNSAKISAKAKSEFLANMSHEIRTPLNAILGFVDLLKDECKDKKPLEYLSIIDSSGKSLLQIIEDILDFSKIESGKLDIEKIDFNTKEEFEIVTYLFIAKASDKNITLTLNLDNTLPKIINTDPLRIKQVISNLLSNAIKFTPSAKKIFVDISYKKNHLHVSVKDEGKGIAKDKLLHIFESFSQEDSSTTREFGGTGLGLTISSALIKLLGGELKVKSEFGVGSEFYFSIPAAIGKDIIKTTQDTKDAVFKDKKILLVEDNKANQMFMKVLLKKLQLDYDVANDGLEAIEKFKDNKYDAILMDENMPNMNGIEATKRILEIEKEHNLVHTPIIALTANAIKGDRERFLEAGMDEYLTKPVNKKKLAEVLSKFLGDSA